MREEWIPIDGGTPKLHLWPEDDLERLTTPVERALLDFLAQQMSAAEPNLDFIACLRDIRVSCREFTGYGAYLVLYRDDQASAFNIMREDPGGCALLNWAASSRQPLLAQVYSTGLGLFLELVPVDGENWLAGECRDIVFADLNKIVILPC